MLEASLAFSKKMIYWEILRESKGRGCLTKRLALCVGREAGGAAWDLQGREPQ